MLYSKAKKLLNRLATKISFSFLNLISGFLMEAHPEWNVRTWSNREARKFGKIFDGTVLNLSGWKDKDKEKGFYKEYFPNCKTYTVSNIRKTFGASGYDDEIIIDLEEPLNDNSPSFDLVFSHTVLEHVENPGLAMDHLTSISNCSLMLVVPFMQSLHWIEGEYYDYWRYTPFSLRNELSKRGFEILYMSWNENTPLMDTYIFCIASRNPNKYSDVFPKTPNMVFTRNSPGQVFQNLLWPQKNDTTLFRKVGEAVGRTLARKK